jgi:hypothetical protein
VRVREGLRLQGALTGGQPRPGSKRSIRLARPRVFGLACDGTFPVGQKRSVVTRAASSGFTSATQSSRRPLLHRNPCWRAKCVLGLPHSRLIGVNRRRHVMLAAGAVYAH